MTRYYQDFVGLNTFIYEPNGGNLFLPNGTIVQDSETISIPFGLGESGLSGKNQNHIGIYTHVELVGSDPSSISRIHRFKNYNFNYDLPTTASFFNALMSKRGNVYGYPIWRQIRVSHNPLSRDQRKNNIFTYVQEPGPRVSNGISRFSQVQSFREPVVTDSNKPVSLVGEVKVYNEKLNQFQNRSVELKTSFGNETAFFANQELNDYFETIAETDENYEQLKELYLDGGLEDEGSPIDSFNMLVYRQSIYPKQQYAFLDDTRSRNYYVNTYWRSNRLDRTEENVSNGFGATVPSQSMWNLDAREDFETRTVPTTFIPNVNKISYTFYIGGEDFDNAEGGPGILQNRSNMFFIGEYWDPSSGNSGYPQLAHGSGSPLDISTHLTASALYNRLHTFKNIHSVVSPSGIKIVESEFTESIDSGIPFYPSMTTSSIFNGTAHWDAGAQSGKQPFYDSYADFSQELRVKAKSFTKVPEFRISSHVSDYLTKGITEELTNVFELSGAMSQNSTTANSNFYQILSNSDFLKHFDLVKKDHKDLSSEKILTLKCKALKKFLPYEGFYPAQRTEQIAKQFHDSYSDFVESSISVPFYDIQNEEQFSIQPFLTPIAAPGILFNTIKSGVAVDYPLIFTGDITEDTSGNEFDTFAYYDDLGRIYDDGTTGYSPADPNNPMINHTERTFKGTENYYYRSIFSSRIPFEALVEPENYLTNKSLTLQEPHPWALAAANWESRWDGQGDPLFKKMSSNFLAEVPEFFIQNQNFKTISSLEEQSPEFGNAVAGNYYIMRVKMTRSRSRPNYALGGYDGFQVTPPQDVASIGVDTAGQNDNWSFTYNNRVVRETLTMYSRPSAFGPPLAGDGATITKNGLNFWNGSTWGYNFAYTPPYYHGDSWCDMIFYAAETKKYSLSEILAQVKKYPYYTRYWDPSTHDAMRDLTGYSGSWDNTSTAPDLESDSKNKYQDYKNSPWRDLIDAAATAGNWEITAVEKDVLATGGLYEQLDWTDLYDSSTGTYSWQKHPNPPSSEELGFKSQGPQCPTFVNYNAMQLDSSVNLFGKGTIRTKKLEGDGSDAKIEVASSDTVRGKTRWIIQPKFETPILNFNKYTNLDENNCTPPSFAKSQVPRGMWHQYGDLPAENEGVYLEVEDVPKFWLRGALRLDRNNPKIKSLADLVGFKKEKVRLGEVANVKEISEAVVAVPFIEKDGTRQFFSIPRADIDSCIGAVKREVEEGTFVAGGPPKAGDSVYQMVKKMKKYVFPPSMDFVKYKEIDPFAMYIFEFKHNLTKQDLADIWQNLPPEIGTRMEEAEATISHELLAHELLGGGAVVKNGTLDDNAEGNGIPSNIQWMIFKAKKRAKTNYFDKVVAKKGTTEDTSSQQLENAQGQTGDDLGITYNWPYDFFSLVELVKIDAEVTFANIENDDKGQKTIKKVEKKSPLEVSKTRAAARGINIARGKGKPKK
jgi:hypothetical protein